MSSYSVSQGNHIEDNVNWDTETVYDVDSEDERHCDLTLNKPLKIAHATSSAAGGIVAADNSVGNECTSGPPSAAATAATFCQALAMRRRECYLYPVSPYHAD